MSIRNVLLFAAIAGAFVLLVRKQGGQAAVAPSDSPDKTPDEAPVVHLVEETLHQHAGEDNPVVHAFEAALEHKSGEVTA